jgi:hypothetical protein
MGVHLKNAVPSMSNIILDSAVEQLKPQQR